MKKFLLGYVLEKDTLVQFDNETDAANVAEDWCWVEAANLEDAKANYEKAFAKWKENQKE